MAEKVVSAKQVLHLLQNRRCWYYTNLKGPEANELLMKRGLPGNFIVRNSSEPGKYTLCVRRETDVIMVKIYNHGEYYSVHEGSQEEFCFCSLFDLLKAYTVEGEVLKEKNGNVIRLVEPLQPETKDGWYYGSWPVDKLEPILKAKGSKYCFLVRDKRSAMNKFVLCVLVEQDVIKNYVIACENDEYFIEAAEVLSRHCDLKSLVEHYQSHELLDNSNLKVVLGEPVVKVPLSSVVSTKLEAPPTREVSVYTQEFESLQQEESQNQASRSAGQKPENRLRNRYKNILPYDHSRVVLKDADANIPGDDYINANYIVGENNSCAYIAAQGCLAGTRESFWRMIWQEKVQIIVMVTQCVENGKNKCVKYWPKDKGVGETWDGYGYQLVVTMQEEKDSKSKDFVIRKFTLARHEPNPNDTERLIEVGRRNIYHYQYTAWPDKSVPKKPESLLTFLSAVNEQKIHQKSEAPIVVHCSAGIGRTGTYIVIGLVVEKLSKHPGCEVSIKQMVSKIRQSRSGMVQTEIQYKFIYSIVEYYKNIMAKAAPAATANGANQLYVNYNPHSDQAEAKQIYQNIQLNS